MREVGGRQVFVMIKGNIKDALGEGITPCL
jgi:hypothetical protein